VLEDEAPPRVEPPPVAVPPPTEPYLSGFVPLDSQPPAAAPPVEETPPMVPAQPVASAPDGLLWADLEA
jgi:hypothetical protein